MRIFTTFACKISRLQLTPNHTDNRNHNHNHNDTHDYTPSPSPPPPESLTRLNRTEYEEQIEKTERLDEVEPGLSHFRAQRELHVRQLKDLNKRSNMVNSRIDKINDDVEKLRQQWGNLEREKAGLLVTSERYEQMTEKQEAVVRKDDATGFKYHAYLTLNSEVLVLDDDDEEEEDDDADRPMHDGGAHHVAGEDDEMNRRE